MSVIHSVVVPETTESKVIPQFMREGLMYYTVANGSGEPTHTGQLKLRFGKEKEPTSQQAGGVGPIDVMFKCLEMHAVVRGLFPKGLKLTNFVLHADEGGSKAAALVRVRLMHDGSQADGEARSRDIFLAGLNALIAAANELLRTDSSASPRLVAVEMKTVA